MRVSRNKKTGKAKHYAFLEFQYPEVAATAAEAMNDYMLFTQKLVVRVVPKEVRIILLFLQSSIRVLARDSSCKVMQSFSATQRFPGACLHVQDGGIVLACSQIVGLHPL